MNDDEALACAKAALRAWDVPDCTPRLIKNRENAVFEVIAPDGGRAALRLHRSGYQTDAAIRSEMIWAQGLAKAGMNLPHPVLARDGDVIVQAGRVASMVTWINGAPLGEGGEPFAWDEDEQARLHHALGAELARLHQASDTLELPNGFERPTLDVDGLLGEAPLWGRFWENAALTQRNQDLLTETQAQLRSILRACFDSGADFGLIHADALRENVMVQDGTVALIDFDDGVFGFRLYELGVAMSQNWALPNAGQLAAALVEGYGLNAKDAALVPVFTVMRVLASCGWAMPRYAPDSPVMAGYAERAVTIAERFMAGKPVFGA